MRARFYCGDERRRAAIREPGQALNGIDFLEVLDDDAPTLAERQRILLVRLIKEPSPALRTILQGLTRDNVRIEGGASIRGIVATPEGVTGRVLTARVDRFGDFSGYTLRLAGGDGERLAGMDQVLSTVAFSFKVDCPSGLDCRAGCDCPIVRREAPEIDYLARDFNSFRRLILDRMSVIAPNWQERNAADLGMTLVELLAYMGDHLAYEQDAIATEAYLRTARLRTSVRRHTRLLDYTLDEGSNARVWAQVSVSAPELRLPLGTPLLTRIPGLGATLPLTKPPAVAQPPPLDTDDVSIGDDFEPSVEYAAAVSLLPVVFETMHAATLHAGYDRLPLYTWGARECHLPSGATAATLKGLWPELRVGDVLVFVEEVGPRTGEEADADPGHRHAVRLTAVDAGHDDLFVQDVTEVAWASEDALPFALCLAATADEAHNRRFLPEVSAALGNIVLADHGRTLFQDLEPVPGPDPRLAPVSIDVGCDATEQNPAPTRYRPKLGEAPLTRVATTGGSVTVGGRRERQTFEPKAPAATVFAWQPEDVRPSISLADTSGGRWTPRPDLLGSDEFAPEFAVEAEEGGTSRLRFGDDEYGMRPPSGGSLKARYRVGNGLEGNIGAHSLAHVVMDVPGVVSVSNPMPARGGRDPEPAGLARINAPAAFRVQQRAVTPQDYAEVARRHPQVQRAAATLRWTGAWHTVFLAVDRVRGLPIDAGFEAELRRFLERFRLAAHDLEFVKPQYADLELELEVCVLPDHYAAEVEAALLRVLSNREYADGTRGLFHPDRLSFGQTVYLSPILAAAQAVEGVQTVEVLRFQRLGLESRAGIDDGFLQVGRSEIARLDNDPSFPDRGSILLHVRGGR